MSKDNMLLGYARGKVGSLVFARRAGVQITRAYNANPSNPRTTGQQAQRMLMATAIQAYRGMQIIVDHSFENAVGKAGNMKAFVSQALKDLRANHANFAYQFYGNTQFQVGAYKISKGSLPKLVAPVKSLSDGQLVLSVPGIEGGVSSYQDLMDALGLERVGDIATYVFAYPSAVGGNGFTFVRMTKIADAPAGQLPATGDTSTFIKVEVPFGTTLAVPNVYWNAANAHARLTIAAAPMMYLTPGIEYVAQAAISSHLRDGVWYRSDATLGFVNQGGDSYAAALATWPSNNAPVLDGGAV